MAFSPDGKAVLTGSYDQTARLWDAATGTAHRASLAAPGRSVAVAFSPDGKAVLTGSYDQTARLWDAATAPSGLHWPPGGPAVAFSPTARPSSPAA